MYYLTYNDSLSGIYKSQVIDVVKYFNSIQNKEEVKLIALISLRNFFKEKSEIQKVLPGSRVLPMFPTAGLWRSNYVLLWFIFLFSKRTKIIARGPFATSLALRLKKAGKINKVIFDGRGAYNAELNEYNVVDDESVKKDIINIEEEVVLGADNRIAVSNELVKYWSECFSYNGNAHSVIPCTLSEEFNFHFPSESQIETFREKLGYISSDIVFIYSGSSAGWQSFELVDAFMNELMNGNKSIKLIILANNFDGDYEILKNHKENVHITWVKQSEVKNYLLVADYGIIYREQSITNKVASPVKFGEYLSCGLKVVISENLGDYSKLAEENDLGISAVQRVAYEDKKRLHEFAMKHFLKENYKDQYLKLLS
jgi:hypothetical protein